MKQTKLLPKSTSKTTPFLPQVTITGIGPPRNGYVPIVAQSPYYNYVIYICSTVGRSIAAIYD